MWCRLFIVASLSITCQQAIYMSWPRTVSFDVNFSIAAAQHALFSGEFGTLAQSTFSPDLAEIVPRWQTGWPPVLMLLYFCLMKLGMS